MKNRDCIGCIHIFECPGKEGGGSGCIHFEKEKDGRQSKNLKKESDEK